MNQKYERQLKKGVLDMLILNRLEEDKLVQSRWSEPDGKQVARKYYHITEKGKTVLQEIFSLWKNVSAQIDDIMEG